MPMDGPLMTYNQFMDTISRPHRGYKSSGPNVTEQYAKYKEEFILRQDKKFFHQYKDEEWLKEKYHPVSVVERAERSMAGVNQRRSDFMEMLSTASNAPAFNFDVNNSSVDVQEEGKFFENAVFIRSLPSSIDHASILKRFKDSPGFLRLVLSEPNRGRSFTRFGWAFFASQEDCSAALASLQGVPLNAWVTLSLGQNTAPTRPAKFAPAISLTPERIQQDLSSSISLAQKLDDEAGISPCIQLSDFESFLDPSSISSVRLLNIVQAYLRNVHFSCYYCALFGIDEEELRHKCHLVHRRSQIEDAPSQASQVAWAAELDSKISSRIVQSPPVRDISVIKDNALKPFYEAMTAFESENKYRCGMCSKLFRGVEFVEKHLKLKHVEECNEEAENRLRKLYFECFRSDPDRPGVPPQQVSTTSQNHPVRGIRRGPSHYGGYQGGHASRSMYYQGRRGYPDSMRNHAPEAHVSVGPIPAHLKKRSIISYSDLDAPVWSPPKPSKMDYGFGKNGGGSSSPKKIDYGFGPQDEVTMDVA